MSPPTAGTFWLIMQGAMLAFVLLRGGMSWRLCGVLVGFEAVYACETTGHGFSLLMDEAMHLPIPELLPFFILTTGTLILVLSLSMRQVGGSPSGPHRQGTGNALGLITMTLGMLLDSRSIVLLILWLVITSESLSLVHTRNEEDF